MILNGHLYTKYKEKRKILIIQGSLDDTAPISDTYKFIANNKLWGQHEYFPMEKKLAETMSKKEINQSDLDLGYYIGTEKLKGTPTNWIYVKWNTNSAYIDLERIEEVLKVKPFSEAKQLNLPLGIEIK